MNKRELKDKITRYNAINEEVKEMTKEMNELKGELKDYVLDHGTKDDSGSYSVTISPKDSDHKLQALQERRVITTLKPEAIDIIESSMSRKERRDLLEKITIVKEDLLKERIENGDISSKIAKKVYSLRDNYAFKIRKIEK